MGYVMFLCVAAFEVYGASVSGTGVLEAGVRHRLLTDSAIVDSSHVVQLPQPPAAAPHFLV